MPYLAALAVTVIVEVPIYLTLRRRASGTVTRAGSGMPLFVAVNLSSHPILWFALSPFWTALLGAAAGLAVAEGLVVLGEGLTVARLAPADSVTAVATAAIANAASFGLGLML